MCYISINILISIKFETICSKKENNNSFSLNSLRFFVDDIPIRVFKNNTNHGVNYPTNKMHIEATIWNATAWVGEVDWSQGPFTAYFREFSINGCQYQQSNPQYCYRNSYYWNRINYWKLSPKQQQLYEVVREKQMTYDYCLRNAKDFPEC